MGINGFDRIAEEHETLWMERILEFPLFYVDLQKMYSLCYEDGHIKRTLSYAVEELNIKEDEQFHRAICDAEYTAK